MRDARATAGVLARHVRELVELPSVDVAERQLDRYDPVAFLTLRLHIGAHPAIELRVAAERGVVAVERGGVRRFVVDIRQVGRVKGTLRP